MRLTRTGWRHGALSADRSPDGAPAPTRLVPIAAARRWLCAGCGHRMHHDQVTSRGLCPRCGGLVHLAPTTRKDRP